MNKAMKLIVALVVVIVVAATVILLTHKKTNTPSTKSSGNSSQSSTGSTNDTTNANATITYDGSSFEPGSITIKAGQKVKIVNQSSSTALSFNSDPHPTHTDEPELNAGNIDPGVSETITVTKVGNWGYHNHYDPSQTGRIIVTK